MHSECVGVLSSPRRENYYTYPPTQGPIYLPMYPAVIAGPADNIRSPGSAYLARYGVCGGGAPAPPQPLESSGAWPTPSTVAKYCPHPGRGPAPPRQSFWPGARRHCPAPRACPPAPAPCAPPTPAPGRPGRRPGRAGPGAAAPHRGPGRHAPPGVAPRSASAGRGRPEDRAWERAGQWGWNGEQEAEAGGGVRRPGPAHPFQEAAQSCASGGGFDEAAGPGKRVRLEPAQVRGSPPVASPGPAARLQAARDGYF